MSEQTFVLSGDPYGDMQVWPRTSTYRWVVNHFRDEYHKNRTPKDKQVEVFEVTVTQQTTIYNQVTVRDGLLLDESVAESA